MAKKGLTLGQQFAIGSSFLFIVILIGLIWLLHLGGQPYQRARSHAERVAKSYADLKQVDSFAVFNGERTYYSLLGQRVDGETVAVLVPEQGQKILVYPMYQGISADEARELVAKDNPSSQYRVIFGLYKNQPVWEVYTGQAYYFVSFEDGELILEEAI